MRALLLAAGKATRLGSLSQVTPKCLHEVNGEPLLDRIVKQLRDVGVGEILINTHHLAPQIEEHVRRSQWRAGVNLSHEPELLGTLGTVRANADFLAAEGGWILHADNLIVGSLRELIDDYSSRPSEVWGALLTFRTRSPDSCGVVSVDERQVMTGFFEKVKDPPTNLASAATMILDERAISFACQLPQESRDLSRDLLPLLKGKLRITEHVGAVIDIGTPEGLTQARTVGNVGGSL